MSSNLDNEDGEDDYMSDAFLKQCEDNRTSLLFSHKEQYKHKLYKKRAECEKKSKKELTQIEIEKRNEALEKPICSANKGFILLEKMMGKDKTLDKNDNKNDLSALMNERKPIQIDFKKDRKGFGHEAPSLKRKENPNQEAISENDFIQNKRSKSDLFYTKKDFFNCQRSCVTLDQSNNRNQPLQDFFWPPEHRSKNDETQEDEDEEEDKDDEEEEEDKDCDTNEPEAEIDFSDKLRTIVDYLRKEYFYCNWCGVKYVSDDDIETNCPGDTRNDHND